MTISTSQLPQTDNTNPSLHHFKQQIHHQQYQMHVQQQQQQQQQQHVSTKAIAITSNVTQGTPPPPLMGSALVLVNDSTLHCFGGRLETRELTNCHYVFDVDTNTWDTIQSAPVQLADIPVSSEDEVENTTTNAPPGKQELEQEETPEDTTTSTDPTALLSLSLTTDPVNSNSGSLSDALSIPPQPRYFHTLNAFGTSLVLFGGMGMELASMGNDNSDKDEQDSGEDNSSKETRSSNQSTMIALNDLHVFDIVTQRWQQKHPTINAHTPRARWAHMATILDHYLVVIGGMDPTKAYVEDACVLNMLTWEWVASIQSIGQCGSYRTIAATGPSKQSSSSSAPSSPSFPSANACWPQSSSGNLAWSSTADAGALDNSHTTDSNNSNSNSNNINNAMASISMVLSGRISTQSSSSTASSSKEADIAINTNTTTAITIAAEPSSPTSNKHKQPERLLSGELTPAFRTGKDVPSIYLYSNYNFQNLQRDFKVITPHYTHPALSSPDASSPNPTSTPSFSLVEKSQALGMMGSELPPGLRFPQGHVYQSQMIVTGTLIVPGKAPTLAIYSFNLSLYKWEQLSTDTTLDIGSWNRTLLHPATGTLLIFGNYHSNPELDYSNRLQHHAHVMRIDLQAYGLYERPIPSLPPAAQELGQDLLANPSLCDMQVVSSTGTLFGANSTMLTARWPEFSTLLLSPPYVTPLILILPVPDEVVPFFLHYIYTGTVPQTLTAGVADYLLILAHRYDLHGLYAITMDILHQMVYRNPVRVYSTALMAGEFGLQARAIGLAFKGSSQYLASGADGRELPPAPTGIPGMGRASVSPNHDYSNGGASPSTKLPYPPSHGRANHSRNNAATDRELNGEGLLQQYSTGQRGMTTMIHEDGEQQQQTLFLSTPNPDRLRKMRAPPNPPAQPSEQISQYPGFGLDGSNYANGTATSPLNSPGLPPGTGAGGAGAHYQTAYPSPLSPLFQPHPFSSQPLPAVYGDDDVIQDERTLQAKKRLQMQMQYELDPQDQQEYLQQHMRDQEMLVMEQHRLQQQRHLQKQQRLQVQKDDQLLTRDGSYPSIAHGALDYHFGSVSAPIKLKGSSDSAMIDTMNSQKSGSSQSSGGGKGNKKEKGLFNKMKPPKPSLSGADLMKSAGF
ncbi:hypothetical protein BG011_008489 [Mortierella polycephala]|uniref:BTB domain-containing protein n=1 Tax=Mortierella polycephala TaxID=41804 RepID=A0A9P6PR22_9FUNG|nr:hypothetical protein BG011_008489 [Mortierella polycephala]